MSTEANFDVIIGAKTADYEKGMERASRVAVHAAKLIRETMEKEMKAAQAAAEHSAQKSQSAFEKLASSMKSLGGIGGIGGIVAGFVSVNTLQQAAQMADRMNTLEARIRNATAATGDFKRVNEELFRISQRNGAAFEDTVSVFQSLARSSKELGATNSDMMRLTDSVQKLGVIGGSSTEAMKNGLLQFSQAMAGGVVHAEEFNSIIENMPEVANRIAQGMGLTVGQLRTLVAQGKVASKEVFDALMQQTDQINKDFEKMPVSLDRAGQMAQNSIGKMALQIDRSVGFTKSLALAMSEVSKQADAITSNIQKWSETKINLPGLGTQTTQGDVGRGIWDVLNGGSPLAGMKSSLDHARELAKAANAPKEFGPPASLRHMETDAEKKAREDAAKAAKKHAEELKKQAEHFAAYLKSLKEATVETELQTEKQKEQLAITKALYDAEQRKGAVLTEHEKKLVTAAALEKARADAAKAAAKEADRQKAAYEKASAELAIQAKSLDMVLRGEQGASEWAEKRAQFEEKIKELKLTSEQKSKLMAEYDANISKEQEAAHQKILQAMKDEADAEKAKLNGTEQELPLLKLIREEREKGLLTQERENELREQYWQTERTKGLNVVKDMLDKGDDELRNQYLKYQGLEDYIPLAEKAAQIQKDIRLSDQDKQEAISALRQQTEQQRQLNSAMESQKRIVEQIMKSGSGYVNQTKQLQTAFSSGSINLKQYNDAMQQLVDNGKKASDFATDFATKLTKGMEDAVTGGKKLSDVFKSMAKDLAGLAVKKLTPYIANGMDRLLGGIGGLFGGGGGTAPPAARSFGGGMAGLPMMPAGPIGGGNPYSDLFTGLLPNALGASSGFMGGAPQMAGPASNVGSGNLGGIADDVRAIRQILSSGGGGGGFIGGGGGGGSMSMSSSSAVGGLPTNSASAAMRELATTGFARANMAAGMGATYSASVLQAQAMQALGLQTGGGVSMGGGGFGSYNGGFGFGFSPIAPGISPGLANINAGQFWQAVSTPVYAGGGQRDFTPIGDKPPPMLHGSVFRPYGGGSAASSIQEWGVPGGGKEYGPPISLAQGLPSGSPLAGGGGLAADMEAYERMKMANAPYAKPPKRWSEPAPAYEYGTPYLTDRDNPGWTASGNMKGASNVARSVFDTMRKIAGGFLGGDSDAANYDGPFWEKPMSPWGFNKRYGAGPTNLFGWKGMDIGPTHLGTGKWPNWDYGAGLQSNGGSYGAMRNPFIFDPYKGFAHFATGGRFSGDEPIVVGERGKELIVPETAGRVIPNNQLGSVGGGLKIAIHNHTPAEVQVQEVKRPDGGRDLIATIGKMQTELKKQMQREFGLKPAPMGR